MDSSWDFPQIGQENPLVSTEQEGDEDLFNSFFDWQGYCDHTQPPLPVSVSHYPGRISTRDLSKIITEIPSLIGDYSLETLGNDFLRMSTSYSHGQEEPVSVSEYSGGQTPPELVRGGSTSPSDRSGSIPLERDDYRHHGEELREVQARDDEWTYPQTHPNKHAPRAYPPAYPPQLQVQEDYSRRPLEAAGGKRRRSSHSPDTRQRKLSDPAQTAVVRKSGACLPCRVTKTRCQESGVCPTCRKAFPSHSHLACTRLTPVQAGPVIGGGVDVWSVNPGEEEQLRLESRFFTGKRREIAVYFSRDVNSSTLSAIVQAYHCQDGSVENPKKAAFSREDMPSYQDLQRWVEVQIQRETSGDFRHLLQNFLLAYSAEGHGLPKHDLVSKVHSMNCFFRILKTSSFWCRDPMNKLSKLPMSVQAELRLIAKRAVHSLEYDVMKLLDDVLAQQNTVKPQDKLAIWASLWQLILMWRDYLVDFQKHIAQIQGVEGEYEVQSKVEIYRDLCDKMFPLLTVFYHYQFRTKKSLELSLDWLKQPPYSARAVNSKRIRSYAKDLIGARKKLYESIQSSKNEIDGMLSVFVVNHEQKKINSKSRSSKGSK